MIKGSNTFLHDVLRCKCSGGLPSPVRVETEVAEVYTFIVEITSAVTGIFIAGTGTGTILLSLVNWATCLSVALQ